MIPEFIQEYFVDPIKYGEGYNWVNTITYGLVLIAATYVVYRYLKPRITMDEKFYYSVSTFILVGASARVIKDMGVSESYILVTPLIFFLIFGITFVSLIVTVRLFKEDYYKYLIGIALVLFCGILIILIVNAETFNVVYYVSKFLH
jgi:uncharacterized membrane protein